MFTALMMSLNIANGAPAVQAPPADWNDEQRETPAQIDEQVDRDNSEVASE